MGERMGHGKICGDRAEFSADLGRKEQISNQRQV
jgi:hypothetical protein